MNNKIIEVQEIVFNQLKRLDNEKIMEEKRLEELARSNEISNNAQTFVKVANLNIRIMEMAMKQNVQVKSLTKTLGLLEDETV